MILPLSKRLKPVRTVVCFLTVSQWSDSSKAGFVFILAGFQSLLYFCTLRSIILYPLFFMRPSFISRGFVVFLTPRLSLLCCYFCFLFSLPASLLQFHLVLNSNCVARLKARYQLTAPARTEPWNLGPPDSNKPPGWKSTNTFPASPPSTSWFYPTGLELLPLFLTSVL